MSTLAQRRTANQLLAIRLPSRREARDGAEIVFHRVHEGCKETIYAAVCYEGWQQWGAVRNALSANVEIVEQWRRGEISGFIPTEDGDE
jgi:hypothetical protein